MKSDKGSITIEMSIVLPIFIFIFLFINGLFSIIAAHNTMTHALIQTSKSLAMDSYIIENYESVAKEGEKFWGGISDMVTDLVRIGNDPYFSSMPDWYNIPDDDVSQDSDEKKAEMNNVALYRFVGFLAGGDCTKADRILKDLKVKDGLLGLDMKVSVIGKDLSVNIKYGIQYWFDFLGMGVFNMNQTIKTTLWK